LLFNQFSQPKSLVDFAYQDQAAVASEAHMRKSTSREALKQN
jgi:hypothetical protein